MDVDVIANTDTHYFLEQPWLPFSELITEWEEAFHTLMLNDSIRMTAYETAIKQVVKPGDVVLDLGAGTGILSQWAIEAGAKLVYAIEMDYDILQYAIIRLNKLGYGQRFKCINKISYEVELPEKVDVLISEIIGNLADNEDFQPILKDAIQRFLKPNGQNIPQSVSSFIVPVCCQKTHQHLKNEHVASLNKNKYSLKTLLVDKNIRNLFNLYYDTIIPHSSYLARPEKLKHYSGKWDQPSNYYLERKFKIQRPGDLTGFKGYFVSELNDRVCLDISGDDIKNNQTSDSWKHAYLPIQNPIKVKTGDSLFMNFTRSYPEKAIYKHNFRQIYHWKGVVIRNGVNIGEFNQCLDESKLIPI